jgi:hypothetical protein
VSDTKIAITPATFIAAARGMFGPVETHVFGRCTTVNRR